MSWMTAYMTRVDFNSKMLSNLEKIAWTAIKYKFNSDENLRIYEMKERKLLYNKVFLEEVFKCLK